MKDATSRTTRVAANLRTIKLSIIALFYIVWGHH
jgi:hypothetical protein